MVDNVQTHHSNFDDIIIYSHLWFFSSRVWGVFYVKLLKCFIMFMCFGCLIQSKHPNKQASNNQNIYQHNKTQTIQVEKPSNFREENYE